MKRNGYFFSGLILLTLMLFLADLAIGSIQIPFRDLLKVLEGSDADSIYREILFNYRLPKAITAVLAGCALSVAGLLMQTLFRNPLAGPDVLGVNAGASMGVALLTFLVGGTGFMGGLGSWGVVLAAVMGAVAVLLLVLLVSVRIPDLVSLLIVGMMFGYLAGSVVSVLQNLSNPDTLKIFVLWTFGSLSSVSWSMLPVLLMLTCLGLLLTFLMSKRLDALLLGEYYAKGLGVPVMATRILIMIATALLAGGVTAFTGPIGFIGITVPHIARGVFRSWSHSVIIPASMLFGASLLLLCDMVTQMPFLSAALPINSVTALFGAPMIIWILLKNNK
jgi:iron complex transport system permease protein